MTPRLGRIPYLNTEPFFADDEVRAGAVVEVPSRMIDIACLGAVDIAPLPVVAAFDHPDVFRTVGGLGIAASGAARSVLLRSRVPIDQLSGAAIGVIDETATSVRLLRVLLQFHFDVSHTAFVGLEQPADAVLLRLAGARDGLPFQRGRLQRLPGGYGDHPGLHFPGHRLEYRKDRHRGDGGNLGFRIARSSGGIRG